MGEKLKERKPKNRQHKFLLRPIRHSRPVEGCHSVILAKKMFAAPVNMEKGFALSRYNDRDSIDQEEVRIVE